MLTLIATWFTIVHVHMSEFVYIQHHVQYFLLYWTCPFHAGRVVESAWRTRATRPSLRQGGALTQHQQDEGLKPYASNEPGENMDMICILQTG